MTLFQRFRRVALGILMVLGAGLILWQENDGLLLIAFFLVLSLGLYSVKLLVYYFTMARFMVGGRRVLIKGVIMLDLAALFLSLTTIPRFYIVLYLVIGMLFTDLVNILRALDGRKLGGRRWNYTIIVNGIGIVIALVCLVNYRDYSLVTLLYAVNLAFDGLVLVVTGFRKTAMVFIQ